MGLIFQNWGALAAPKGGGLGSLGGLEEFVDKGVEERIGEAFEEGVGEGIGETVKEGIDRFPLRG